MARQSEGGGTKPVARSVGRIQLTDAGFVAGEGRLSRSDAQRLVDEFLDEIVAGLLSDGKVLLSGFGAFTVIQKKERIGRNPKTLELHVIRPRNRVTFSASGSLRKRIAQLK